MNKKLALILMLGAGLAATSFAGPKNGPKIADDLDLTSKAPVNVNIVYAKPPSLLDSLNLLGVVGNLLNSVVTLLGNILNVTLPGTSVVSVAANSNVLYIAPNRGLHPTLDYTTAAVDANVAFQSGFVGSGVGIAIIDSGINPHPDLAGRIVYNESFVAGDASTLDTYGHGTHVAGIAAGTGAGWTRTAR